MKIQPIIELKHYFICPSCGEGKMYIDHLMERKPREFGPSYCDHCDKAIEGRINEDGSINITPSDSRMGRYYAILQHKDILLIVKGQWFKEDFTEEQLQFLYDEHLCPTTYLHDVVEVVDVKSEEIDPHGIFQYIDRIPCCDREKIFDSPEYQEVIKKIKEAKDEN